MPALVHVHSDRLGKEVTTPRRFDSIGSEPGNAV